MTKVHDVSKSTAQIDANLLTILTVQCSETVRSSANALSKTDFLLVNL